jgi:hypothetical protein
MFTTNPFADLPAFLSPALIQAYVVLMIVAVFGGTLFDVIHKGSGQYFSEYRAKTKLRAKRTIGGAEAATMAVKTLLVEVVTAGEFCSQQRRVSHLFMFYGFITYLVTTLIMVFGFLGEGAVTPSILPLLWNIGALMVVIGGSWFFFLLRVDVSHEHHSPFRLVRADMFIVSLLSSVSFALLWEISTGGSNATLTGVLLALYIFATTFLFVSVPWSKFAHMFYKPVMAYQRRLEEADGSSNLPSPADIATKEHN